MTLYFYVHFKNDLDDKFLENDRNPLTKAV